ncbi:hypothetical protein [Streptomyces profundus]|uniref:hypothetical protein n=1 Tax=Streptomyces profundus TaxID=2867410 RepID=UPI001D16B709|nr:hypothetical protein [Streptomyces sp. MA3_2.13]UED83539.1 hypothetical protein K4G22_04390 [Streptomyces sp. MA3_2.13]
MRRISLPFGKFIREFSRGVHTGHAIRHGVLGAAGGRLTRTPEAPPAVAEATRGETADAALGV